MKKLNNIPIVIVTILVMLSFFIIVFFPAFPEYLVDIFRETDQEIEETQSQRIENILELIPRESNRTINLSNTSLNLPDGFEIVDAFINNPSITAITCVGGCSIYQIGSSTGNTYYLSTPGEARFLPQTDNLLGIVQTNEQAFGIKQYNYVLIEIDEVTNESREIEGVAKEITACSTQFDFCFSTGVLPVSRAENESLVEEFRKLVFGVV